MKHVSGEYRGVTCDLCLYGIDPHKGLTEEGKPVCSAPKSNFELSDCGFLTINEQIRRLEEGYQ